MLLVSHVGEGIEDITCDFKRLLTELVVGIWVDLVPCVSDGVGDLASSGTNISNEVRGIIPEELLLLERKVWEVHTTLVQSVVGILDSSNALVEG